MIRSCRSENYNWDFDSSTGFFQRWGKTVDDNPTFSPMGPEILDLEISTICHGTDKGPCLFCYKANTENGKYMSYERFEQILLAMPRNLTQIAFGIGDADSHPQLEQILRRTLAHGIIPNITINGYRLDCNTVTTLASLCGGISVSRYDKETCYSAIHRLRINRAKQLNIHQIISPDTIDDCLELIDDYDNDPRLEGLNAIVFLMAKPKGRARNIQPVSMEDFKRIIDKAYEKKVPFGLDSCSSAAFLKVMEGTEQFNEIVRYVEPCESFLFSSYANVDGEFFPCSFCEGEPGWETGIKVDENTDFINDVWNNQRMLEWRSMLTKSNNNCVCEIKDHCRACPVFKQVNLCK